MKRLTDQLICKKLHIAVAESCTGGALSARLSAKSGASIYFDRGFVTYSNQSKIDMLGVSEQTLAHFGAVSEQTALEMVRGVVKHAKVGVGVSVTGIAGPTGGGQKKPIGTVCFAFFVLGEYTTCTQYFKGTRTEVVNQSVAFVLGALVDKI
jgi:nicotinamide-nucleotide amidase